MWFRSTRIYKGRIRIGINPATFELMKATGMESRNTTGVVNPATDRKRIRFGVTLGFTM